MKPRRFSAGRNDREEATPRTVAPADRIHGLIPVVEALRAGRRTIEHIAIAEGAGHERIRELIDLARAARVPVLGSSRPARIRSSVVFPEPFGPTRPMWSPSNTPKERPSNNGAEPNDFPRS